MLAAVLAGLAGAVVLAVPAGAVEPPAPPGIENFCMSAQHASFADVSYNTDAVECLAISKITTGYPDGTFRPGQPVLREQMASFLVRLGDLANRLETDGSDLQDIPPYRGVNRFVDVDSASPHVQAVNRLAEIGVTQGSTPATFDPKAPVTRAQMATFLNRMDAYLLPYEGFDAEGVDYFTDDDGSAHEANINAVASTGIAQGTAEARFSPGDAVTRSQMASFLVRYLAVIHGEGNIEGLYATDP